MSPLQLRVQEMIRKSYAEHFTRRSDIARIKYSSNTGNCSPGIADVLGLTKHRSSSSEGKDSDSNPDNGTSYANIYSQNIAMQLRKLCNHPVRRSDYVVLRR
jgi:hypothetical protein